MKPLNGLFEKQLKVANLGLETFYEDLKSQSVEVIQVDWRPPAGGNEKMLSLLGKLKGKK
ncbi:fdrA domain protein [Acidaminobacter sp.]|uniref:fdrA domain protein n=1 Tax=Acidaminobacter sp. TaxID=1872102 RepID=UPI0013842A81|nr:fdrA domain protein [Acidaminobacter sp.]MDK9711018.1 fdrA domain protein [Acidaminobacter sp.]MZQ98503.1 fdrA domain protein [Acidaminobacter sp.]